MKVTLYLTLILKKKILITVEEKRKVINIFILDQEKDHDEEEGPRNVRCANQ